LNGATATAQGDGMLSNDESQDWVITNITTDTRCRATEASIPAGYTGSSDSGPEGSCDSGVMVEGDQASCTITNTLNSDTIRVIKTYTDGANFPVDVRMECTSGDVDDTGTTTSNTKQVSPGNPVSFTVLGFNQSSDESGQNTQCRIIESNLPDDYHQVSGQGCQRTMAHNRNQGCELVNGPDRATFIIEKEWNQLGDTDGIQVTGHLSCTGATTTQQNVVFTATTDAILFVYNIFDAQGPVDCTVWEDVPPNYRARYSCDGPSGCGDSGQSLDHCFYGDVEFQGVYRCTITNTPLPANITVTKTWIIEGADQGFNGNHNIVGVCDSLLHGPTSNEGCLLGSCYSAVYEEFAAEGSKDYEFTIVKPRYPFSNCQFFEDTFDNVIESENGCGRMRLSAGDDVDCEIVNTVFFEGIPTLNQYGMAILALLMLGVGFVGFRRFI
jgi:hypothetical protein